MHSYERVDSQLTGTPFRYAVTPAISPEMEEEFKYKIFPKFITKCFPFHKLIFKIGICTGFVLKVAVLHGEMMVIQKSYSFLEEDTPVN